jgi:hypothetical protein
MELMLDFLNTIIGPGKMINKYLLIRNIRGNWSAQLLYEFYSRNKAYSKFGYLNAISYEYLPPIRPSRILFFRANKIESIKSKLFYRNPLPEVLFDKISSNAKLHNLVKLKFSSIVILFKLIKINDSSKLLDFKINNVPYGQFLYTPLIAKIGIKHFYLSIHLRCKYIKLYLSFIKGYETLQKINIKSKYTHIVLINGRDAFGAGCQLLAYTKKIKVFCLEHGLNSKQYPRYGVWYGNMHHWKVRHREALRVRYSNESKFTKDYATKLIQEQYLLNSKWWEGRTTKIPILNSNGGKSICFFTSSEKETTTFPSSLSNNNDLDKSDQSSALKMIYEVAEKLDIDLIIRMHPNFSKNRIAKRERKFFYDLTKSWKNTTLIYNNNAINSFELAKKSWINFTFRSSIGAELEALNLPVYYMAPTTWGGKDSRLLIKNKKQLSKLLSSSSREYFKPTSDYQLFAAYNSEQGQEYKFIEFREQNSHKKEYAILINDLELDVPRFKFISQRN